MKRYVIAAAACFAAAGSALVLLAVIRLVGTLQARLTVELVSGGAAGAPFAPVEGVVAADYLFPAALFCGVTLLTLVFGRGVLRGLGVVAIAALGIGVVADIAENAIGFSASQAEWIAERYEGVDGTSYVAIDAVIAAFTAVKYVASAIGLFLFTLVLPITSWKARAVALLGRFVLPVLILLHLGDGGSMAGDLLVAVMIVGCGLLIGVAIEHYNRIGEDGRYV